MVLHLRVLTKSKTQPLNARLLKVFFLLSSSLSGPSYWHNALRYSNLRNTLVVDLFQVDPFYFASKHDVALPAPV